MFVKLAELSNDFDRLKEIERIPLRLVTQALLDYRTAAAEIFRQESDQVADIGEDITREALDLLGMHRIDQRLFGKIDYKRACYVFHPDFAVKQALGEEFRMRLGFSRLKKKAPWRVQQIPTAPVEFRWNQ